MKNELSRPFDVHKWSDHSEVNNFVSLIYTQHFNQQISNVLKKHLKVVLIDIYNFIRSRNPQISASNAVFNAARERFRPVMLTTITTVVGLLPLANGMSIDLINRTYTIGGMVSSWWQPLASAIVNGLLVATILTLLLTPAMLLVPEIISKKLGVRVANYEHGT